MDRSSSAAFDRTTRGLALDLSLSEVPRGTRGRALVDSLRSAVLAGALAPGTSLPSTRALAGDLGVSRGMVVDAYAQLVAEGHFEAQRGSGTRVGRRTAAGPRPLTAADCGPAVQQLAGQNPGQPDPALFPRREWLVSLTRATAQLPDAAFAYGEMQGLLPLRRQLVEYLGRMRNIVAHPDQVIVVNGFAQTLACVATMLARRGPKWAVAVEDPGSRGLADQLRWWRGRVVPIPVDERGLDVAGLARCRVDAVVVTPAHQYPTGVTLAAERRHALVDWATRRRCLVIEDDYDAEYRYDREPLTSLHALCPAHVIAAGSVSKSLSPALRLGWMVAPPALVAELAEIKGNIDLGTAVLAQAALADFIATGALDRHLRRSRARYRQRRDALVSALQERAPGLRIAGIAAGLHVLVYLDPSANEDDVAAQARALGLTAQPLGHYRQRPGPPGIVLGYGALTPERATAAAAALAPSWKPAVRKRAITGGH